MKLLVLQPDGPWKYYIKSSDRKKVEQRSPGPGGWSRELVLKG